MDSFVSSTDIDFIDDLFFIEWNAGHDVGASSFAFAPPLGREGLAGISEVRKIVLHKQNMNANTIVPCRIHPLANLHNIDK